MARLSASSRTTGASTTKKYGQEIELPELAAEILAQFLAGDRASRRWQRGRARTGNGAAASEVAEA